MRLPKGAGNSAPSPDLLPSKQTGARGASACRGRCCGLSRLAALGWQPAALDPASPPSPPASQGFAGEGCAHCPSQSYPSWGSGPPAKWEGNPASCWNA